MQAGRLRETQPQAAPAAPALQGRSQTQCTAALAVELGARSQTPPPAALPACGDRHSPAVSVWGPAGDDSCRLLLLLLLPPDAALC